MGGHERVPHSHFLNSVVSLISQTLDICRGRVWSSSYAQIVFAHSANFLSTTGGNESPSPLALRVLCTAMHVPDIGMHSIVIKSHISDKNALKSTDHKVCSLTK